MAVVNISLPEQMKQYVEARIDEGSYNTTSEYIRDLIREDQKKQAEKRLETLLLRGMESPASEWTKDDVDHIKAAVRERLAAKMNTTSIKITFLICAQEWKQTSPLSL
ncbi:MAG: putative addiction module antidote protein family [Chthonomonadales bacterium]|nr:putative addiction module antidote protein family [Chthonomonadales bacterium]